MAPKIVWSSNALSDRIQILEYWIEQTGSNLYSKKLDKMLREIISLLARFPQMGRRIDNRDERFVVKQAYQIFYRIVDNEIHILHIWDSRRNPDTLQL